MAKNLTLHAGPETADQLISRATATINEFNSFTRKTAVLYWQLGRDLTSLKPLVESKMWGKTLTTIGVSVNMDFKSRALFAAVPDPAKLESRSITQVRVDLGIEPAKLKVDTTRLVPPMASSDDVAQASPTLSPSKTVVRTSTVVQPVLDPTSVLSDVATEVDGLLTSGLALTSGNLSQIDRLMVCLVRLRSLVQAA